MKTKCRTLFLFPSIKQGINQVNNTYQITRYYFRRILVTLTKWGKRMMQQRFTHYQMGPIEW